MNGLDEESPMGIQWTICRYENSDLQPGHANPGSSESNLAVSYTHLTLPTIYSV